VEKIYLHIEKLLAQHDYVIVPNLGGFVIQRQSAQCLKDRVTPPSYTVAFNPLMQHTDGLLVIEIARAENITYRQANELLEKQITIFKQSLNTNQVVEFGKLGILLVDNDQNIIFNPTSNADFLPLNFGLNPVFSTLKVRKPRAKTISFNTPSIQWQKIGAAAIIVFGLLVVTPSANDTRSTNTASLTSFIQARRATQLAKDTVQLQDTISSNEVSEHETSSPSTITKSNIESESKPFHVIVGSWSGEKSALKHCEILKSENFKDVHIVHPEKGYHIAIQSFSTKDEAIECMKTIRKSEKKFSAAWVLCEEKI
jgi:CCDC81-like prokaryotic HU domain 1/CCDC81-like prokaryotic HU domain 2